MAESYDDIKQAWAGTLLVAVVCNLIEVTADPDGWFWAVIRGAVSLLWVLLFVAFVVAWIQRRRRRQPPPAEIDGVPYEELDPITRRAYRQAGRDG
jgi:hypothetical protein